MPTKESSTADRELVISRELNAPIDLVWEVWTNPRHIAQWWGPNGFTTTIHHLDMKKDGDWKLTMHGPDGTNYENHSRFLEVIHHKKIVYDHISHPFRATIHFEARGEKTFISWHMLFETREEFIKIVKTYGAEKGLKENVEKLSMYVNTLRTDNISHKLGKIQKEDSGFKVTFERQLDHDIETVWEAITDPGKLKYWFTDIEFTPKPGEKMKIIFRDNAHTVTNGEIVSMNKPTHFVWTWEGELAEWDLTSLGKNKCKLVFTYSKLPDQYAVGAAGGFHTLVTRLEQFLKGDKTIYPFGTEEFDPVQAELREKYGEVVFDDFPQLEAHNPVRMEKVLNAPVEKVWRALTEREQLKKWYFDFPDTFKPVPGQEFEWTAGPPDGKKWLHRGKIIEVVKNKKLVHSWEYPGYSGHSELSWELEEAGSGKTKLILKHKFTAPFDLKEEALRRKNFVSGWKEILKGLSEFIER